MGSTELLLIGLVALIVVGPKELPGMFRMLGQATAKIKKMAREFTRAMEDAADDAGVGDLTSSLRSIADPKKMGLDAVKKAADFNSYTPGSETEKLAKRRSKEIEKNKANVSEPVIESSRNEETAKKTKTKVTKKGAVKRPDQPTETKIKKSTEKNTSHKVGLK
jgi:sec-independent protein translocase protein TatB